MESKSKHRWFWAWLVEMTLPKGRWNEPKARGELWRNLVVIRASSTDQAVSKALRLGEVTDGDCCGTLRINGEPGLTKFLGVEAMGLIHENLEDGCEILWQLRKCQIKTARHLVKKRGALISYLDKELEAAAPASEVALREVKRFIRTEKKKLKRDRVAPGDSSARAN
jgi:hypothetical protein